jgi:gliding motility-associated-like protein
LNYENSFTLTISPEIIIEKGENTEIKVDVQPAGIYSFNWTPRETLACNTCASTLAEPPVTTKYVATVSVPGSTCFKKIQTQVSILCGVFVPTAFTPNDDQMNDIFYVVGSKCVKQIKEILIYNRWGELVFRDENFVTADSSHGWDGNYQGKSLNPDIFTYKITAEMKNGEVNDFSGAFTLLR